MASQQSLDTVRKVYLAYYGRPADVNGLDFWANQLDGVNGNLSQILNAFGTSAEATALFGTGTTESKVNNIYKQLFNRDAEPTGLNFYTQGVNNGTFSLVNVAQAVADGASGADLTTLNNKLAASNLFTTALDTSAEIIAYSGNDAAIAARAFLAGITTTAATQAQADAAVAGIVAQSNVYNLTTGIDATNGQPIIANVFNAFQAFNPAGTELQNTLQDGDRLQGTGATSTLTASLGNAGVNSNGTTITPSLQAIPTINIEFIGSSTSAAAGAGAVNIVDLQDTNGAVNLSVTRISNGAGAAGIVLQNIQEAATNNLSIAKVNVPTNVTFDFANGILGSKTDAGTLNLSAVALNTVTIDQNSVNGAGNNNGFNTLTVNSTGINSVATLVSGETSNLLLNATGGSLSIANMAGNAAVAAAGGTLGTAAAVGAGEFQVKGAPSWNNGGGILSAVNGGGSTGDLTFDFTSYEAARPDPQNSGVIVTTTVTGGSGNDKFITAAGIRDTGFTLDGGTGTNTLVLYSDLIDTVPNNANNPNITNIQNLEVRAQNGANANDQNIVVDVSEVGGLTNILVRNEVAASTPVIFDLRELTQAQANAITINHSVSRANAINTPLVGDSTQLLINLDNASGATDTVTVGLTTDLNNNQRFNFALDADGNQVAASTANDGRSIIPATLTTPAVVGVENITINDTDNESNTIELVKFAEHSGVIKLTGGVAGQFMNLDATANAYRFDQSGADLDGLTSSPAITAINARPTAGNRSDVDAGAAERIIAGEIDAAGYAGNIVVRVSDATTNQGVQTNTGGQKITMGTGNDTVIFDQITVGSNNLRTAGLTLSDTVDGGTGTDVLGIDGHGVNIQLTASEWTNVKNFEIIRLVGNDVAANNARNTLNSYNLTLTNELLATNGAAAGSGRSIIIVNDNDAGNDAPNAADDLAANLGNGAAGNIAALTGNEGGVTIDATALTAANSFEYRGEEGASNTADRFIFRDANINGGAIIDGGALDNLATTFVRNNDVLEVETSSTGNTTLSEADLANVSNVGTVEFTNDNSVRTTGNLLVVTDATIDNMVDRYHTSSAAQVERMLVKAIDSTNVAGAVTDLRIQANGLTNKSALDVFMGRGLAQLETGAGNDSVVLLGNYNAGVYAATEFGEAINTFANNVAGARVLTANDLINLGTGTDTLTTYGSLNLTAATLTSIENMIVNSDITMTETQFRNLTTQQFTGLTGAHTLTITADGSTGAIDLSKITVVNSALTITNNSGDAVSGTATTQGTATVNIAAGGALSVTLAQALGADFRANNPLTVLDTGANIATGLTNGSVTNNDTAQPGEIDFFDASDNVLSTTVAGLNVATNARLTAADTVTALDTGANIAALSAANIAAFTNVDFYDASNNVLAITVAQANAITNAKLTAGDVVTVADTGANIAALSAANFTAFTNVDAYDATDNALAITVAQANAITNAKLTAGDVVTVADTGANIAALSAANFTAFTNVDVYDATDNALSLSVAQLDAVTNAKLTAADVVTAADTGANLAANVGGLGSNLSAFTNVDTLDATDNAATLTFAQIALIAAGTPKFAAGDTITFNATTGADRGDLGSVHAAAGIEQVVYTAANQAVTALFADVADNTQLANTDTFTFTTAATVDVLSGFTAGTDKVDLKAFNLLGQSAATQFTTTGTQVANGQYAVVQGDYNVATGVFTANNAGADSAVFWDGDTGAGVTQVGVVITGAVATAADLILA